MFPLGQRCGTRADVDAGPDAIGRIVHCAGTNRREFAARPHAGERHGEAARGAVGANQDTAAGADHFAGAFGGGVSARVAKVAAQKQTDKGPGVIAGAPAVAFTLQFTNRSGKPISVNTVNVTATYGHNSPAVPANLSSNRPLRNDIRPGRTATGVYAFVIPKASRGKVSLAVWYAQGKPTVVFSGSVS